jgi:ABC-2 type transport system permease protein
VTTEAIVWKRKHPGWSVIGGKELTDHLVSVRFLALLTILALVAVATVYQAAQQLRDVAPAASETTGVFLRLFTIRADPIPFSFLSFVAFLGPILGIAFGFDAVNGERAQGTLPRLASQPIHRDDIINGKFVASLTVISLIMTAMTVIIAGLGITLLGITPTSSEAARLIVWLAVAVVYVGLWLALALLCSVATRRAATAALAALAIWLVLSLFGPLLAQLGADTLTPVDPARPQTALDNARLETALARISPIELFDETSTALLDPEVRSTGIVTLAQVDRALVTELSLTESVLVVWPYLVGLIAVTVVLFAVAYVVFMRQEVRA